MQSYTMRTKTSCGPDAVGFAVNQLNPLITQAEVDKAWGIEDIRKFGNIGDTPLNHVSALERLKVPHSLIDSWDILAGKAIDNQTVILLHNAPVNAETRSIFTELARVWQTNIEEHWVVLESVNLIIANVRIHTGNGSIGSIGFDAFRRLMDAGFVRCAYVVGRGSKSVGLWAKMKMRIALIYSRISGKFY